MSTQYESASGAAVKPRRKTGLWWAIGGGVLALVLIAAAAIAIPRILHANRVADYQQIVAQTGVLLGDAHAKRVETDRATVLYALQFDEALDYLDDLEELAGYTDHYFSTEHLEALGKAHESLAQTLNTDGLSAAEADKVTTARGIIESQGLIWQTPFLNLGTDATEQLVEHVALATVRQVPDEAVTELVLEEARAALLAAEAEQSAAEEALSAAVDRARAFTDAIASTLAAVSDAAVAAPDQAEVMLGVYPNTSADVSSIMRDSATLAAAATDADLFTVNDDFEPIPVIGETPADAVTFAATDAWRAALIAAHLRDYSDAITLAWLEDRGGVSEILGRGPGSPFGFPF